MLGKATGAQEEAQALLDANEETVSFLEETVGGLEKPAVYLGGNSSFLSTAVPKCIRIPSLNGRRRKCGRFH